MIALLVGMIALTLILLDCYWPRRPQSRASESPRRHELRVVTRIPELGNVQTEINWSRSSDFDHLELRGSPSARYRILARLVTARTENDWLCQADLRMTGISSVELGLILADLLERGLIERAPHTRTYFYRATENGRSCLEHEIADNDDPDNDPESENLGDCGAFGEELYQEGTELCQFCPMSDACLKLYRAWLKRRER